MTDTTTTSESKYYDDAIISGIAPERFTPEFSSLQSVGLGMLHFRSEECLEFFEAAAKFNPKSMSTLLVLAKAQERYSRLPEAAETLAKLYKLSHQTGHAEHMRMAGDFLHYIADKLFQTQRYAEARTSFTHLHELSKGHDRKNWTLARDALDKFGFEVIPEHPDFPGVYL